MKKLITTAVGILSLAFGLAACSESPRAADTPKTNSVCRLISPVAFAGDRRMKPLVIKCFRIFGFLPRKP